MKKMQIFEPAMCCSTGLCGVGVDPELLRISNVLNSLEKNGVKVERFNLTSAPQEFVKNDAVNNIIKKEGVGALPLAVLDSEIVMTGRYPTNEELVKLLNIPVSFVGESINKENEEQPCGCCCSDDECSGGSCC